MRCLHEGPPDARRIVGTLHLAVAAHLGGELGDSIHRRIAVRVTNPYSRGDLGCATDEPGVGVLVLGAGLARGRAREVAQVAGTGPAAQHTLQGQHCGVGDTGSQYLGPGHRVAVEAGAV